MIRFKEEITIVVVTDFDEATENINEEHEVIFKAHEPVDADIYREDETDYVDIQFGNGSIALSVQRECFIID